MKNIAVYCGANKGIDEIYDEAARKLGAWICDNNYGLVYGGGKVGLMGTIADAVLAGGGEVTGIIPEVLVAREIAHPKLSRLEIVSDMSIRKKRMLELSDVCIALPGGPGTLEEIAEAISWGRIGELKSPCIFYNIQNYYDYLAHFFDHMVAEGFLSPEDRGKICFAQSLNEIANFIEIYRPPKIREYEK